MFKSLLSWSTYPITIQRTSGFNKAGDRLAPTEIATSCYLAEEIVVITDKTGKEYVSRTQMYLPPDVNVLESDFIKYAANNIAYEVRKISRYRDGSTQHVSMQVVYL